MSKTANEALKKAMQGGDVSDNQAKSALGAAVDKITSLTKKAEIHKEAAVETGVAVVHLAETEGSLFLASMAEGYFGEDKMKVANVDVRAPLGFLAQGFGLYQTITGAKGGGHALALGNGLTGSWLASVARKAGQKLREKKDDQPAQSQQQAQQQTQQGPAQLTQQADPSAQGPIREVLLTPRNRGEEEEDESLERVRNAARKLGRRAGERREPGRRFPFRRRE